LGDSFVATINKRGPHQYQVIIRRKGYPTQTKTFLTKDDADKWIRDVESGMDAGTFRDRRAIAGVTLHDALGKYLDKVTPTKRGSVAESNRIKQLQRHPLAQRLIGSLLASDFSRYRDERLAQVSGSAVRLELALLSHLYTIAIKEWSWPLIHELRNVRKPKSNEARERRLEGDEKERLLAAVHRPKARSAIWLEACIRLALETGMRAGEILSLTWEQVDLDKHCIRLNKTKNGCKRTVGLTDEAVEVLHKLPRTGSAVITNFYDTSGLDRALKGACKSAGIENLHFHDLRHETASRLAPLMQVQDLAKVMGWQTLQMAMRYYNPTDAELVALVRRGSPPRPIQNTTASYQIALPAMPNFAPSNVVPSALIMKGLPPMLTATPTSRR
jgi:integrase